MRTASDGSVLAAGSYAPVGAQRSIRVWDAASLNVRSEFDVPRGQHIWAASQDWLVTFDTEALGSLVVYDIDSGAVLARPDRHDSFFLWAQAVAPDGSVFYSGETEGKVLVFDTSTWETIAVWEAYGAPVRGLALAPDGARLVTTGEDDFVKVSDVSQLGDLSLSEPPPLLDRIPAPFPSDAAWLSADRLAVFLADGAKWLEVSLSVDELVAEAQQRLTRGFTVGECATYQIDPCPTTLEQLQGG